MAKTTIKKLKDSHQQGDLIFRKVKALPEGEQKVLCEDLLILEASKTSGHTHSISSSGSKLIQIGEDRFIQLVKSAALEHNTHKPHKMKVGLYQLANVREFDWFTKMTRAVID